MHASGSGPFTLDRVFERSLRKYADRTAVAGAEESLTYRELDRRSERLARRFADAGVAPDDNVGVLLPNGPTFAVVRIGVVRVGAAFAPLDPALTRDELVDRLSAAGIDTLVVGPGTAGVGDDLRGAAETVRRVLDVGDETTGGPSGPLDDESDSGQESRITEADAASIVFTGGTTGRPKAVVHDHRRRTLNLLAHLFELDITGDDRLLLTTPLSHGARLFLKAGLLAGATVHVREGFDVEAFVSDVRRHDVTWTFLVPTMLYRLLDHDGVTAEDLSSLDTVAYGAAPIRPSRLREAVERFGPVFLQFYGQAEVPVLATTLGKAEHAAAHELEGDVLSSAGSPCLLADVRVVDPDTADPLGVETVGEIAARAPYAMQGYFEDPVATRETIVDGWVLTGDVGKVDDQGRLHVLDRKSNVVVTGGMNVYTTEVEEAVGSHPLVEACAVLGVEDPEWGEAVVAAAVRTDDSLDAESLRAHAAERLAGYKLPKRIDFVDEIPTTPYGKVDKDSLANRFGG